MRKHYCGETEGNNQQAAKETLVAKKRSKAPHSKREARVRKHSRERTSKIPTWPQKTTSRSVNNHGKEKIGQVFSEEGLGQGVEAEKDSEGHRKDRQWIFLVKKNLSMPRGN